MKALNYVLLLVIAMRLWGSGFIVGCREGIDRAKPVERARLVYVDRPLTPRDTATDDRPAGTRIYVPVRDTVNVFLPSPVGFVPYGLISPTRLQIDGRRGQVTLNYFEPDSVRWQRDTYVIPPRRWGLYTDAGLECSPVRGCAVDLLANVRFKSVTGHFGYQIGEFSHGWTGGVRVKLVGWR
jgi:hypothetical protein